MAVTGRSPDTLAQAQQELGKEVIVIKCDAGQVGAQKHLAAEIAKVFDKLDIDILFVW